MSAQVSMDIYISKLSSTSDGTNLITLQNIKQGLYARSEICSVAYVVYAVKWRYTKETRNYTEMSNLQTTRIFMLSS